MNETLVKINLKITDLADQVNSLLKLKEIIENNPEEVKKDDTTKEKCAKTIVEICIFKPTGFSDRYIVNTDNRGKAIIKVIGLYSEHQVRCINYVQANYTDGDGEDQRKLTILEL